MIALSTTFGGFPAAMKACFFFHCGIELDDDEGRHIEGLPQVSKAAMDKALFATLAGIAGNRREPS